MSGEVKIISSFTKAPSGLGMAVHNAAFAAAAPDFRYVPRTVESCEGGIKGIIEQGIYGTTVSMPFKEQVLPYLNLVDPVAQAIGSVNTILNKNGFLEGYNYDWLGAVKSLQEATSLEGKNAAIIGAGGAARAIAYGLVRHGCMVAVFNRTPERAGQLAARFNIPAGGNLDAVGDFGYDILINATPVGSAGSQAMPVHESAVKEGKVVMDIVTMPMETSLLRYAKSKECKIVSGYRMYLYQAAAQFELWTGKKAPFEVMEKAALEALKH